MMCLVLQRKWTVACKCLFLSAVTPLLVMCPMNVREKHGEKEIQTKQISKGHTNSFGNLCISGHL